MSRYGVSLPPMMAIDFSRECWYCAVSAPISSPKGGNTSYCSFYGLQMDLATMDKHQTGQFPQNVKGEFKICNQANLLPLLLNA